MKPADNDSLMRLMSVIKDGGDFILVPDEKMPKYLFMSVSFKILKQLDGSYKTLILPFANPDDMLCVVYHPLSGNLLMNYIKALTPNENIVPVIEAIPNCVCEPYPVPELEEGMLSVDFSMFEVWKKPVNKQP